MNILTSSQNNLQTRPSSKMHLFVAVLFLVWAIGLFIFHTSRQRVLRMRRISDPNKPLPPPPSSSSLKLKKIKK